MAATWYGRAAEQGDFYAQYLLAQLYDQGWPGVPQDNFLAYMWFDLSAAAAQAEEQSTMFGDYVANLRDSVAERMAPAQIAEAQRRASEWQPKVERNALK